MSIQFSEEKDMKNQKYFYRWVILFVSFLLMAVPFSIVNTIHTLFMKPVTEEFGFSISAFSLIFTISAFVVAAASPVVGKLLNVVSIKTIMTACAALVGAGFICYSFASAISVFYGIGVLVAVGMAGLTTIPIATMITNWFAGQRGFAMGVAFAGGGTGTFFWMQIVSRVIENYGYHYAYLMLGGIILLVAVPISLFFVYRSPEDKYKLAANGAGQAEENPKEKVDFKKIMQNKAFLPFAGGVFLMGISIAGVQIHIQSYLASLGYALAYNANVGSTLALSALAGSVLGGFLFDRLDTRFALLVFGAFALAGLAALMFAEYPGAPFLFAVVFGLCLCLPSLWPSYGVGKIFRHENYSSTLGLVNLFFVVGGACGPFFSGLMADSPLGYKAAWAVYFVLTCAYLFLFTRALKHKS